MTSRINAILLGMLLLASNGCYPNPQPSALTPIPTLAPEAQGTLNPVLAVPTEEVISSVADEPVSDGSLGAHLFQKNCTPCHGIEGQGVDAPPLRNNDFVATGDQPEIFATVADGRQDTEMPAWLQKNGGPLTSKQIDYVIAYLGTLQGVSHMPTSTPPAEVESPEPTPAPGAPTPEPARPSISGDTGEALTLTGDAGTGQAAFGEICAACHGPEGVQGIPNPGSDDGAVPELNPIDPTIANADPAIFGVNVDLFIEHGSVPEGPAPRIMMPTFGDSGTLTNQQIADLIAYVIHLNSDSGSPPR